MSEHSSRFVPGYRPPGNRTLRPCGRSTLPTDRWLRRASVAVFQFDPDPHLFLAFSVSRLIGVTVHRSRFPVLFRNTKPFAAAVVLSASSRWVSTSGRSLSVWFPQVFGDLPAHDAAAVPGYARPDWRPGTVPSAPLADRPSACAVIKAHAPLSDFGQRCPYTPRSPLCTGRGRSLPAEDRAGKVPIPSCSATSRKRPIAMLPGLCSWCPPDIIGPVPP